MNNVWHFLREFESKELVKRYIKNRYDYSINTSKAIEITSAFSQGREYFFNSNEADISVRPLLQYYGVVALSRGLILVLNKTARENNKALYIGGIFKNSIPNIVPKITKEIPIRKKDTICKYSLIADK